MVTTFAMKTAGMLMGSLKTHIFSYMKSALKLPVIAFMVP
jgi:hypothetical protein